MSNAPHWNFPGRDPSGWVAHEVAPTGVDPLRADPLRSVTVSVSRGKLEADQVKALMGRVSGATDYAKGLDGGRRGQEQKEFGAHAFA